MIDRLDVISAFQDAIISAGLLAPEHIEADGQRHRFRSGESDKDERGWYLLFIDHAPAGKFGCFSRYPDGLGWSYGKSEKLPAEELVRLREQQEELRRGTEERRAKKQAEAAERAEKRWARAKAVMPAGNPYLSRKGVAPHGLREDRGGMLIPLSDGDGKIWSIQTINQDSAIPKKIVGRKAGCWYALGRSRPGATGVVWVAEGFATAATVAEITDEYTIMAVDAGNLSAVCLAQLELYPEIEVRIAADNDLYTKPNARFPEGNPGVTVAKEAAAQVRELGRAVKIFWPTMPDGASRKATDWNDLSLLAGRDEVARQLGIERSAEPTPGPPAPPPDEVSGEMVPEGSPPPLPPDWGDAPLRADTGKPWPRVTGPFELSDWGLAMLKWGKGAPSSIRIANQPIWVEALSEGQGDGPGLVLQFFDRLGRLSRHVIPGALLHAQGQVMAGHLSDQGFRVVPGHEKDVARYLAEQEGECERVVQSRSRLGWYHTLEDEDVFVLPTQVIGSDRDDVVYRSDIPKAYWASMRQEGSLKDWQRHVAGACTGNPLLQFGILTGLAGPLLFLTGEGCGGFHFFGTSSRGKTTLSQAAATVWGSGSDPASDDNSSVRSWDLTINALEGLAELHSHQLLVLDEIARTDIADPGRAVYKLASGSGKERATISGGLRSPRSWLLLFISNGEQSLRQLMGRKGADFFSGQRVRLVDIPASDAVVDPHGVDSRVFVEDLKASCAKQFGSVGPAFVAYLVANVRAAGGVKAYKETLKKGLAMAEEEIALAACEKIGISVEELPGEVRRGLKRFALVCLAGVLAGVESPGCASLVPWTVPEVYGVVSTVAGMWLSEIGRERSELDRALSHVRGELMRMGGRIQAAVSDRPLPEARDRLGWRYQDAVGAWWYLLIPAGWEEICGQYDAKLVLEELSRQDLVRSNPGHGYRCKAPRGLPGLEGTRPRLVWLSAAFVGEADDLAPLQQVADGF